MIEILVVVVIIGVLMSIGVMSYINIGKNGRDTRRRDDLNLLQKQFELYYQAQGSYPEGADATSCYTDLTTVITTAQHPLDPDTGTDYTWHRCDSQKYCICTVLELPHGNASDLSCGMESGEGLLNYCVRNLQTLDDPSGS